MMKPIATATATLFLGLAAACSSGPLATRSSSEGSSNVAAHTSQQCAGLSGIDRQDCLNGYQYSQTIGNRATGGAGGSAANAPGTAGTSGGASGASSGG